MKLKSCPHCNGNTGFAFSVFIGGIHEFKYDFKGNMIDNKREGSDDIEKFASCLDCKKLIEVEKLNIKNV